MPLMKIVRPFVIVTCLLLLLHASGWGTADTSDSRLRVLTYNAQFLPDPASLKNERPKPFYRARRIAEEIKNFDLVALQEVFNHRHRKVLEEAVRDYWAEGCYSMLSPQPEGFYTHGGCLILSRLPIVQTNSTVFQHFSQPADYGLRADGFAAKGIIHARIALSQTKPPATLDVYATHLEARADDLRPKQYTELAAFIRQTRAAAGPVLLMGDFNTYGMPQYWEDPVSQYSQLMQALAAAGSQPSFQDLWRTLHGKKRGNTTHQESVEIGKRIDYLFLDQPSVSPVILSPLSIRVRLFQDPDQEVFALSDHNGVAAVLRWRPGE